jgi:hypothetical protein
MPRKKDEKKAERKLDEQARQRRLEQIGKSILKDEEPGCDVIIMLLPERGCYFTSTIGPRASAHAMRMVADSIDPPGSLPPVLVGPSSGRHN